MPTGHRRGRLRRVRILSVPGDIASAQYSRVVCLPGTAANRHFLRCARPWIGAGCGHAHDQALAEAPMARSFSTAIRSTEAAMSNARSTSRRNAITGLASASAAIALTSVPRVAAQTPSLADHPLVGAWLVMITLATSPDTPVVVTSVCTAEGFVFHSFPTAEAGERGVTVKATAMGVWEAVDDRTGHFTTVQVLASADGTFAGTLTVDGHPRVSEDGTAFEDVSPDNHATIRNAENEVIADIPGGSPQPVRGYRIMPGNVTFPEAGAQATPAAVAGHPPQVTR
jgi:hypothetical protein